MFEDFRTFVTDGSLTLCESSWYHYVSDTKCSFWQLNNICNLGHNILAFFKYLAKRYLISSITNLVLELPHELPNDLRLRKLGNIRKMSNWVETQPSAQSSFILHFWGLVQFYCISLLFAKYFVQDCRVPAIKISSQLLTYWLTILSRDCLTQLMSISAMFKFQLN